MQEILEAVDMIVMNRREMMELNGRILGKEAGKELKGQLEMAEQVRGLIICRMLQKGEGYRTLNVVSINERAVASNEY